MLCFRSSYDTVNSETGETTDGGTEVEQKRKKNSRLEQK